MKFKGCPNLRKLLPVNFLFFFFDCLKCYHSTPVFSCCKISIFFVENMNKFKWISNGQKLSNKRICAHLPRVSKLLHAVVIFSPLQNVTTIHVINLLKDEQILMVNFYLIGLNLARHWFFWFIPHNLHVTLKEHATTCISYKRSVIYICLFSLFMPHG